MLCTQLKGSAQSQVSQLPVSLIFMAGFDS